MKFLDEEKKAIIADYTNGMRPKELSLKYGRNSSSIINMLKSMSVFVPSKNRWTKEEIRILIENYPICTSENLKELFPTRRLSDLHYKANKLGISRDVYHWKDEDIAFLKKKLHDAYSG